VIKRKIRLSFALRSEAAQQCGPSRSSGPASWNLSLGRALAVENSGPHPKYPYGVSTGPVNPGPMS
jgi:hypothetical protein